MKIAIACNKENVSNHFGHCEKYLIYDVDKDNVIKCEEIKNPGHKPKFLPEFLYKLEVQVIISGGMGLSAINLFKEYGIQAITGIQGNPTDIINLYLDKKLESSIDACNSHMFQDDCTDF